MSQSATRKALPLGLSEAEYRRLATWAPAIGVHFSPGALVRQGSGKTFIGRKGSLVVYDHGRFFSFETWKGGDVCELLAHLRPELEPAELRSLALTWLRDHPGLGTATAPAPTTRQELDRAARHAAVVRQVLGVIAPCPGNSAEANLTSRGLSADWPVSLIGYVPDDERPGCGALVAVMTDANGVPGGIQLGYVDAAGQKVEVGGTFRRQFLIDDEAKGLRFHIAPLELDPALPLLMTEGIENALSLALAFPRAEIFGLPGIGRLRQIANVKGRDIVVFADGDAPDSGAARALRNGVDHLLLGGAATVKVTNTPLEEDANSLLQKAGIAALQALVEAATAVTLSPKGVIKHLAALTELDYQLARREHAKGLGMKLGALDDLVLRERARRRGDVEIPEEDPDIWPDPVDDITAVLDMAVEEVARYVVADPRYHDTGVLWGLHSHFVHHATIDIAISPRLLIKAPTPDCGKTTLLEASGELSARPLEISSIRAAGFFRLNDAQKPTLLIDEIQGILSRKGGNEELEAILLASHRRRSAKVVRVEQQADGSFASITYDAWGTFAATLNGRLSPALESRCLIVHMRRAMAGEVRAHLQDGTSEVLQECRRKFARWARDQVTLPAVPMPAVLANRLGDNWRPLFRIAHLVGGHWTAKVMAAALKAAQDAPAQDTVLALLTDAREVFGARDRILTSELVTGLLHLEEPSKDWSVGYRGGPINAYWLRDTLAEVLDPPGSQRWKLNGRDHRGYLVRQFDDANHRYLKQDNHSEQPPGEAVDGGYTHTEGAKPSDASDASDAKTKKPSKQQRKSPASDGSGVSDAGVASDAETAPLASDAPAASDTSLASDAGKKRSQAQRKIDTASDASDASDTSGPSGTCMPNQPPDPQPDGEWVDL
jgi:hypothetical protein